MTPLRPTAFAFAVAAGLLLAGCDPATPGIDNADDTETAASLDTSQGKLVVDMPPPDADASAAGDEAAPSTFKPGADVRVTGALRAPLQPGANGTVDLSLVDAYDSGVMTLTVSGSPGLNVLGTSGSTQMSLQGGDTHAWPVSVSADADGTYFLNIQATVTPDGGPTEMRAFSVRVPVGDASAAISGKPDVQVETTPEGEAVIVLPAEETIE